MELNLSAFHKCFVPPTEGYPLPWFSTILTLNTSTEYISIYSGAAKNNYIMEESPSYVRAFIIIGNFLNRSYFFDTVGQINTVNAGLITSTASIRSSSILSRA